MSHFASTRYKLYAMFILCCLIIGMNNIYYYEASNIKAHTVSLVRKHNEPSKQNKIHLIYSVGCGGGSSYKLQLIEAMVLDYSWAKKKQPGNLTRIVSGCVHDKERREMMSRTSLTAKYDLERFNVWFTEKNDSLPDGTRYVMFNRPTALVKFFQTEATADDTVYGVLDPDFLFLNPIPSHLVDMVREKKAVAGYYGLGPRWTKWGYELCMEKFPNRLDCAKYTTVDSSVSRTSFEAGAPYLMLRSDWQELLPLWLTVMPPTYERYYNGMESDMYAYIIASFAIGLEHHLDRSLMRTCMRGDSTSVGPDNTFIHYCQRFTMYETRGPKYQFNDVKEFLPHARPEKMLSKFTFTFSKYWIQPRNKQKWAIECEAPLLVEPPELTDKEFAIVDSSIAYHSFVLHKLISGFNDAILAYKRKHCLLETVNDSKQMYLHEAHRKVNYQLFSLVEV